MSENDENLPEGTEFPEVYEDPFAASTQAEIEAASAVNAAAIADHPLRGATGTPGATAEMAGAAVVDLLPPEPGPTGLASDPASEVEGKLEKTVGDDEEVENLDLDDDRRREPERPCRDCLAKNEPCTPACFARLTDAPAEEFERFVEALRGSRASASKMIDENPADTRLVVVEHGRVMTLAEHVAGPPARDGYYERGAVIRVDRRFAEHLRAKKMAKIVGAP